MSDTPAEIAAQIVSKVEAEMSKPVNQTRRPSRVIRQEVIAALKEQSERIRELEQENATLTSSGLVKCPLCGGPNSPADGGTGRCFHCECGYVQCGAGHTTQMKQLEQANKELLGVVRIYADAANWKCPRCGKSDSLNCYMGRWCGPNATTGREMPEGGFPGEGHGYDVARAALSKHGGTR